MIDDVIALRRDLHAHPELAFEEKRTTDVIIDRLLRVGLVPQVLPGGTGVVCDIGTTGPMIALRADIDALPISDLKDVPYRSTVEDVCHGCGHDAHTAILLGAAAELAGAELPGRIRLIFQPAEESLPGGAVSVVAAAHSTGWSGSSRCTATRAWTPARSVRASARSRLHATRSRSCFPAPVGTPPVRTSPSTSSTRWAG
ncbi:MAG: hypothetical protein QOF95_1582 [Pseudonocardiales bacterium]|nr:hypothetical protein [Pseudonocardiales bacterium]